MGRHTIRGLFMQRMPAKNTGAISRDRKLINIHRKLLFIRGILPLRMDYRELLTATFTLFAVIDILGSIPILISLKEKMGGHLNAGKATLISGGLMLFFFLIGRDFLRFLGLNIQSFAVGGSIVIFILGLEMVLGLEFFKSDKDAKSGTVVPIAFPLIAGSGTLTTIMSLKSIYEKKDQNDWIIPIAIVANLVIIYLVLRSLNLIARILGKSGLIAVRKFFGVILLAIAVQIFAKNIQALGV
jgi:multiple antibiotic resistance protein